jgi:hypothetical protein
MTKMAPVEFHDLMRLLKSAFAAGAGKNFAHELEGADLKRWANYAASPAPRSVYQRVDHHLRKAIRFTRLMRALKPLADLAKPYDAHRDKWKEDHLVARATPPEGVDSYTFAYIEGWDNYEITVEEALFAKEVYEENDE